VGGVRQRAGRKVGTHRGLQLSFVLGRKKNTNGEEEKRKKESKPRRTAQKKNRERKSSAGREVKNGQWNCAGLKNMDPVSAALWRALCRGDGWVGQRRELDGKGRTKRSRCESQKGKGSARHVAFNVGTNETALTILAEGGGKGKGDEVG